MNIILNTYRKVLTIFALLLILSITASSQMRNIYLDADSTNSIRKISFYSPSQGYVATTKWIGYTADSGQTFTKNYITLSNVNFNGYSVNLTFGFGINGVKAFNKDTVIAYGDYGLVPAILYSTNGCLTFKLIYHSQYNLSALKTGIKDIVFPQNNSIGYAIDADRILKTTNKGLTWGNSSILVSAYYEYLEALDNNNVVAFSTQFNNPIIKKTTNGGATWQNITVPTLNTPTIFYTHFYTANKGWLNVKDNNQSLYTYYTSNGGTTWKLMNNPNITPFGCVKMQFVNDSTGIASVGLFQTFITTDSGKVWQQMQRNNNYTYNYTTHNHFQIHNNNQMWAGGAHGFLEINTNIKATPLPKAFFEIDTIGLNTSNLVKLNNYSKKGYQYAWYKNDTLISNNYDTSYTHNIYKTSDTIKLIVTNNFGSDTSIKYAYFNLPVFVSSFTPTYGVTNTAITITGVNFTGVTNVYFGGVPASSFTVNSNTKITAYVGNGATGNVTVVTSKNVGSLSGFTYLAPPIIDLPVSVSTNIICKNQPVIVTISNTQPFAMYSLRDSTIFKTIGTPMQGNGGTISFTVNIPYNGKFKIYVNNIGNGSIYGFTNTIIFSLENTKSNFVTSKVNIEQNEYINITQTSVDAQTYNWDFGSDANIQYSNLPSIKNISFSQVGLKPIKLISTSANGCKDTLIANEVYVYTKPNLSDVCYTLNINDSDFAYYYDSPSSLSKISAANNNGYFVSGYGNKPILKSRYGISKKLNKDGISYFAHYSTDGVLRWYMSIAPLGSGYYNSNFYGSVQDSLGNIYIIGSCRVYNYLFLPNGDSIRVSRPTTGNPNSKTNGFVLKVDSLGNYLWHTVLDDSTQEYTGYYVQGGLPNNIKLVNNNLYITGSFYATLNYHRNGNNINMAQLTPTVINDMQNNFVLKIDTNGVYKWSTYFQNIATNRLRKVADIGIDANDNVYILGGYEYKVILKDVLDSIITLIQPNSYGYNTYLLKLNSAGKKAWVASYVSSEPNELACDAVGNTYITGSGGVGDIKNGNATTTNVNLYGPYLFKINNNGILKWAVGSKVGGYGYSVYLDKNNLYLLGKLSSSGAIADTSILTSTNNIGYSSVINTNHFIVINYDTAGILKNLYQSGYNTGNSLTPNKIIKDKNQQFLISGKTDSYYPNTPFTLFGSPFLSNGQDAFWGKFSIDFCSTVVPLTLLNFTVTHLQEAVKLNWTTTNQINTSHFNIQRSINSVNFETIGVVNSKGNGEYFYTDKNLPSANTIYYRLEILDKDGTIRFSKIQTVVLTSEIFNITIYPNPSKDNFSIKFPATTKGINTIKILDMYGKTIIQQNIISGSQQINISQTLTKGIYTVQITNSITNKINTQKLIIQ